jgi:hypothetical protein
LVLDATQTACPLSGGGLRHDPGEDRPSVPPGRPGHGVGVKKINVRPYSPLAKLKPAGAPMARAILDTPDRAESKLALATVAPAGTGYELADTS